MKFFKGKSVYKGIALGKILVLHREKNVVRCTQVKDVEAEVKRVHLAKERAKEELEQLYRKALEEAGRESAAIFEVHQMILEDPEFHKAVEHAIRSRKVNAEYAVTSAEDKLFEIFSGMDDVYMKERAADIRDVLERLVQNLKGDQDNCPVLDGPVIVVADDLTPSETMRMDKEKILAFVTAHGSVHSHTAILARMMNIPALVGVEVNPEELEDGTEAVVDGFSGKFIIEPNMDIKKEVEEIAEKELEKREMLLELRGKESVTRDGRKIEICANIGSVSDVGSALENDAEGIGLFRSEFLYMGRKDLPGEEEQFQIYKKAAQNMGGKKVVIRTLDIGADKQAECLSLDKEENPSLGYRAIRICLTETEIFKTQLKALFRASCYGQIAILYPMITSVEEVKRIREIVREVKGELDKRKVPYKNVEEGIMIETPAAVLISDELAELVDFVSIGTNDLTQYTLALDRQNGRLDAFYNPHHKAVLKMIQMVVDNVHKAGKWVGICGELAADPALTEMFVDMGVDELSVAAPMILKLRRMIRQLGT